MTSNPSPNPNQPRRNLTNTGRDITESTEYPPVATFDAMNLKEPLLHGIYSYGFEKPSVIQQKGIIPIVKGRDLVAQAQSGTGKTATFAISSLQMVDPTKNFTQVLILSPTRELAMQSHNVITQIGMYIEGLNIIRLVGGDNVGDAIRRLESHTPHIVVGTPGRINHMLESEHLDISHLRLFILDEADEMLSLGFQDAVLEVNRRLSRNCQTVLVSATMPNEILEITDRLLKNPVRILVPRDELTLDGLRQFYVIVDKEEHKFDTLVDLYEAISVSQCVIFCNFKRKVDFLAQSLEDKQFSVSTIHGSMSQDERNQIMKDFREGNTRVLITTDLLARGIDVQQVSLVLNYDLPQDKENYIHRIGRSARFGRKGIAINFVTQEDASQLKEIQEFYHTQIDEMPENINDLLKQ
ncbi:putative Eukaryotic initiation factor 4A [Blattamonas nauphoetae]|uniref:Eukaryotic initiation factor 4A n=1 Tax=Blattamonas nauphoetae TaxID=2049346 RepID=A0ABQ9YKE5_9EUKA|nr:putative Eukaryotic initiation factor 4A [Blattamonas nauphoetae]